MKLHKDELVKATLAWVFGELLQITAPREGPYHSTFCTNGNLQYPRFSQWVFQVHEKVWRHLTKNAVLDASYSDLEANLALAAKHVFKPHLAPDTSTN